MLNHFGNCKKAWLAREQQWIESAYSTILRYASGSAMWRRARRSSNTIVIINVLQLTTSFDSTDFDDSDHSFNIDVNALMPETVRLLRELVESL